MSSYFVPTPYIYYINSANRINASDSDSNFSYYLQNMQGNDFDRVVVLSASIPKSFYLIQNNQNTFTLKEDTSSVTITVPAGNYNRNSLLAVVKSLLNTNSPNTWVYNITYPNINLVADDGKYHFSVSGNSSQPSLIFTQYLYEQLGFNANSTNTFSGNALVSTNVTNLSTETTLFLHSDISQQSNGTNVLQEIYSNGESSYSYINFQNFTPHEYSKTLNNNESSVFHFTLTDENGNIIDTNGININFTLMCYRTNNIDSMLRGYMKMRTIQN